MDVDWDDFYNIPALSRAWICQGSPPIMKMSTWVLYAAISKGQRYLQQVPPEGGEDAAEVQWRSPGRIKMQEIPSSVSWKDIAWSLLQHLKLLNAALWELDRAWTVLAFIQLVSPSKQDWHLQAGLPLLREWPSDGLSGGGHTTPEHKSLCKQRAASSSHLHSDWLLHSERNYTGFMLWFIL